MAEIRRRRAHPSFLRLLRLFNVDTGSAEIVHTYESDKTFAQSTVTLRHVTPPTPDAAPPPRTRFQHGFTHAGTHAEIVLNGWSGCGWVLGRYRRYLRPRPRHVRTPTPNTNTVYPYCFDAVFRYKRCGMAETDYRIFEIDYVISRAHGAADGARALRRS